MGTTHSGDGAPGAITSADTHCYYTWHFGGTCVMLRLDFLSARGSAFFVTSELGSESSLCVTAAGGEGAGKAAGGEGGGEGGREEEGTESGGREDAAGEQRDFFTRELLRPGVFTLTSPAPVLGRAVVVTVYDASDILFGMSRGNKYRVTLQWGEVEVPEASQRTGDMDVHHCRRAGLRGRRV